VRTVSRKPILGFSSSPSFWGNLIKKNLPSSQPSLAILNYPTAATNFYVTSGFHRERDWTGRWAGE